MIDKDIIVIGGNHHNTLAILRSIGERGYQSMLILLSEEDKPYVRYSKYIKDYIIIHSEQQIAEAMDALHTATDRAIVIACSDAISSYLDRNRDLLSRNFILPGTREQGRVSFLMNKEEMQKIAIDSGLNTPTSWTIYNDNVNIDSIEFPCIVKPLESIGGSKSDIAICKTKDNLKSYLINRHANQLQIQKYITKEIEYQLIGCSINEGEIVIIPGASIILRQPETTNTGFLKYIPINKFDFNYDACKKFIQATRYSGLFSMEFLRDKEGRDYFMEINFRNDGNSICVTASGINLPIIWCLYNSGQDISKELCYDKMKEVLVMPEFNDLENVIHHKVSLLEWLKDIYRTDRFMEFSKYDQLPFWIYIYKALKRQVKKVINKQFEMKAQAQEKMGKGKKR